MEQIFMHAVTASILRGWGDIMQGIQMWKMAVLDWMLNTSCFCVADTFYFQGSPRLCSVDTIIDGMCTFNSAVP